MIGLLTPKGIDLSKIFNMGPDFLELTPDDAWFWRGSQPERKYRIMGLYEDFAKIIGAI